MERAQSSAHSGHQWFDDEPLEGRRFNAFSVMPKARLSAGEEQSEPDVEAHENADGDHSQTLRHDQVLDDDAEQRCPCDELREEHCDDRDDGERGDRNEDGGVCIQSNPLTQ